MYKYMAYGLGIQSAMPLPELPISKTAPTEITIDCQSIDWQPPQCAETPRYWHIEGESAYFYWKYGGKFLVKGGRKIVVDPIPNLEEDYIIRQPILGPLLGMILHQRNYLILHASGVKIGDRACLFLGVKGQGKSTMAATLYGRGHQMMVDDVAAVSFDNSGNPILLPGFPQIKLWPDSVKSALGDTPESFSKIHPLVEKRARPTFDGFFSKPLSLHRIYILQIGSNLGIKQLNPQEAIKELIGNSYIAMTLGDKFSQLNNVAQHFCQSASLVNKVKICSLERPRSLDLLPEVARLVEADLNQEPFLTMAS
ncbi:Hpr(Ser) kinase/phosphatase [Stanieria cyanosphaera PCC 7437]|uniref:Hpr(Ser) kinase/phosphatase n=1 Tax=Stanieria cyanosphaera (strain ATCC 29371 / PCC 7437) TaxID=111780 RepID=K9XQM7_STAC7|nr:Hpr(Ser) kinase/phosphatase [Stanieria cyanosphaera]AFZ34361.1 Hpr(Ser) kinase/phosphatase [Stanieria cyanosphaera PCC 7437]